MEIREILPLAHRCLFPVPIEKRPRRHNDVIKRRAAELAAHAVITRLEHYLCERGKMLSLDPESIHALHSLPSPRHAELTVTDIRDAIAALTAERARADAAEAKVAERDAEIARLRWSNDACWLVGVHGGISGIAEDMRDRARADTTVNAVIFGVAEGWDACAAALRERDEARAALARYEHDDQRINRGRP